MSAGKSAQMRLKSYRAPGRDDDEEDMKSLTSNAATNTEGIVCNDLIINALQISHSDTRLNICMHTLGSTQWQASQKTAMQNADDDCDDVEKLRSF